jgi:nitrate/nitrite sensing protein/histidine kinase/DNA gyrase B/HSP90-like ATPase/HAMP domain-containing protein
MVVSLVEVRRAGQEAADIRSETDLATAVSGPAGVISRLQDERNWAVIEISGLSGQYGSVTLQGYPETRGATDQAVESFHDNVRSKGGRVAETFGDAVTALDGLAAIRQEIDEFDAPRTLDNMPFGTEMYGRYSELIGALSEANERVSGQVEDTDLRQGVELANLASAQFEREADLGRETAVAAVMSPGGLDTNDEVRAVSTALSAFRRGNHLLERVEGRYQPIIEAHYDEDYTAQFGALADEAIATGHMTAFDTFMELVARPPEDGNRGLRDALIDEVVAQAGVLNDEAAAHQRLFTILAFLAFAVAATVAWLVSRSITNPMQSLTHQASELAEERLPTAVRDILDTPAGEDVRIAQLEPLEATTRDEVADVVHALNTVQESALELAVEQAVLRRNVSDSFVNLARRNQNLLDRQIEFITQLESREANPEALDGLFRLDHLATRMRRNAESLLVLAGSPTPRRLVAAVRIGDVMRAALGEVEEYKRVTVEAVEPAVVRGSVASDLSHLVAELVENALTFSPPDEDVVLMGLWASREGRGAYRITVVDQGLGMSPAEVAQANVRLAGSESLTVAPSKYLGQHVAGTLAVRHGIQIRLEPGAFKGVVATVDLPADVVEEVTPESLAALGRSGPVNVPAI